VRKTLAASFANARATAFADPASCSVDHCNFVFHFHLRSPKIFTHPKGLVEIRN